MFKVTDAHGYVFNLSKMTGATTWSRNCLHFWSIRVHP